MKKVFLSLATVAFVAAGSLTVTSCGSDDSTTPVIPPVEEITENFIEVNGDKSEINYNLYAVHTTENEDGNEVIREYTLEDGTKVIAFEFISHNGSGVTSISGADLTQLTLLTLVDETSENKYSYPFTKEGATLNGGRLTIMNGTQYNFASGATFELTDLVYESETQDGNIEYDLSGTDADDATIELNTNVVGLFQGLYNMNTDSAGKGTAVSTVNILDTNLTLRNSLN